MKLSPAARGSSQGLLAILLFIILTGATILLHDYFCHDHLHELSNPLHSIFDNPEPFEAGAFFGSLPPDRCLLISYATFYAYDLIKDIFHPPDVLS